MSLRQLHIPPLFPLVWGHMQKLLMTGISLFSLALASCGQQASPSMNSSNSSVTSSAPKGGGGSLTSQGVPPTCYDAARLITQVQPIETFPAETEGRLSATSVRTITSSSYLKSSLSVLGLGYNINDLIPYSAQKPESDGGVSVVITLPGNTNFALMFKMSPAVHAKYTDKWYKCGVLVRTDPTYIVNTVDGGRVAEVQAISYRKSSLGMILGVADLQPGVMGVLSGQSLEMASVTSNEDAFLYKEGTDQVLAEYESTGLRYTRMAASASTLGAQSLSLQSIIVNPITDPACGSDSSAGGVSGQSIIVCPSETSPEVVNELEASRGKTDAYKCLDKFDDWAEAREIQAGLGWATVTAGGVGFGGIGSIVLTAGAATPVGIFAAITGVTATPTAWHFWQAQGYKARKLRRSYEQCLKDNNVT